MKPIFKSCITGALVVIDQLSPGILFRIFSSPCSRNILLGEELLIRNSSVLLLYLSSETFVDWEIFLRIKQGKQEFRGRKKWDGRVGPALWLITTVKLILSNHGLQLFFFSDMDFYNPCCKPY